MRRCWSEAGFGAQTLVVAGVGFEPTKAMPTVLQTGATSTLTCGILRELSISTRIRHLGCLTLGLAATLRCARWSQILQAVAAHAVRSLRASATRPRSRSGTGQHSGRKRIPSAPHGRRLLSSSVSGGVRRRRRVLDDLVAGSCPRHESASHRAILVLREPEFLQIEGWDKWAEAT